MSQESQKCPKCGNPSGYDDGKVYWGDGNFYLCSQCKRNLINRFAAFFGLDGVSSDDSGLIVPWIDVDRILSSIKRDEAFRVVYMIADKTIYERTKTVPSSILEG